MLVCERPFDSTLFIKFYNDLCDAIDLINSMFTSSLVLVMTNFLVMKVFLCYTAMREYVATSYEFDIFINAVWMSVMHSVEIFIAYAGSSTTDETGKSIVIVIKSAAMIHPKDIRKSELISLMFQMRYRNKNLKNIFFTINWNLIHGVSYKLFMLSGCIIDLFAGNINVSDISHNYLSV